MEKNQSFETENVYASIYFLSVLISFASCINVKLCDVIFESTKLLFKYECKPIDLGTLCMSSYTAIHDDIGMKISRLQYVTAIMSMWGLLAFKIVEKSIQLLLQAGISQFRMYFSLHRAVNSFLTSRDPQVLNSIIPSSLAKGLKEHNIFIIPDLLVTFYRGNLRDFGPCNLHSKLRDKFKNGFQRNTVWNGE